MRLTLMEKGTPHSVLYLDVFVHREDRNQKHTSLRVKFGC